MLEMKYFIDKFVMLVTMFVDYVRQQHGLFSTSRRAPTILVQQKSHQHKDFASVKGS